MTRIFLLIFRLPFSIDWSWIPPLTARTWTRWTLWQCGKDGRVAAARKTRHSWIKMNMDNHNQQIKYIPDCLIIEKKTLYGKEVVQKAANSRKEAPLSATPTVRFPIWVLKKKLDERYKIYVRILLENCCCVRPAPTGVVAQKVLKVELGVRIVKVNLWKKKIH